MNTDMTVGKPIRLILMFALPLFASNLFQQFYNLADTAIVGHMLGDDALSAVGAVGSVYNLITSLCFGMTNGFSILIARYFGAKDEQQMKRSIATSIVMSMCFTLLITLIACTGMKQFLHFINTPEEIFGEAYSYIIIIVAGCIITTIYNMEASIMRALGNSRIPLMFLIISSLLNIGLDVLMIGAFNLGVRGAAIATLLAQFVSAILCFIYILKKCPELRLSREHFRIKKKMVGELFASGIAMSMMYAVVDVGSVVLQSGINDLGKTIIAAHISARKISAICMMPLATLSGTMATYVSQNYGAKKYDRIRKGMFQSFLLGGIWCVFVLIAIVLFARMLMAALTGTDDRNMIETGTKYLYWNLPFYPLLGVLVITRSSLQAIGSKVLPVLTSSIEMLSKFFVTGIFIPMFGYMAVCLCEPVIWGLCAIPVSITFWAVRMRKLKREMSAD